MTEAPHKGARYEIVYLAPARRDLVRLIEFLTASGVTLHRAQEIIVGIVKKLRVLEDNPYLGFSFGGKYGFGTPYRGLVCGKYLAVYEPIESGANGIGRIEVRRIYHTREDCLTQLQQP